MSEFGELLKKEFFIIDSNNLDSVEDRLYGYVFSNDKVIFDCNDANVSGGGEGTYVLVKNFESSISIFQDFNGSYGLYVYDDGENFAVSNSFNYLVEHLRNHYKLSLNEDFAKVLMSCGLSTFSFKETLVNEIERIPRNYTIHIDKDNKTLSFEKIDFMEHTLDLNSREGLDVLDRWFEKWVNIIRSLKRKTNNIQVALSGGFDTRVISVLWLCANIDLNKIHIVSIDDDNHTHSEDFKIATEIANHFDFPLNNNPIRSKMEYYNDFKTVLNQSFYVKLGFNNELNYRFGKTDEPVYYISGKAGETLREYDSFRGKTPQDLKKYFSKFSRKTHPSFQAPTENVAQNTFDELSEEFSIEDKNSKELSNLVYSEVRCCNHFGKLSVEDYFSNRINLTPALDPDLHKLKISTEECGDNFLLITLILLRYCPKLLEFDIEGDRYFDKQTIEYARKINEISPYSPIDYEFISEPDTDEDLSNSCPGIPKPNIDDSAISVSDIFQSGQNGPAFINGYLKDIFHSRMFKMEYMKYLPEESYYNISKSIETRSYFPLKKAFPAFSVLKIINDINYSCFRQSNLYEWLDSFSNNNFEHDMSRQCRELILKYATARIDIKNFGDLNNSVDLCHISDKNCFFDSPKWFSNDEGVGKVIKSFSGDLTLKLKCINDGTLKVFLKSPDVKDANNNRFPVFIDYLSFKINGEEHLEENTLVSNIKPLVFERGVKDGEIVDIHIKWLPFNRNSVYEPKKNIKKENPNKVKEKKAKDVVKEKPKSKGVFNKMKNRIGKKI